MTARCDTNLRRNISAMVATGEYRAVEPDEWEEDPFSVSCHGSAQAA